VKWFVCFALLALCISCEFNPLSERQVEIVITEEHPWKKVSHRPLWHTLVYYDASGDLKHVHLEGGTTKATIAVRRDRLTVFCAYPLSSLFPYGGFFYPGCRTPIVLDQKQGRLASLLLDAYPHNAQAIENLNGEALVAMACDVALLDTSKFLVDLLNGTVDQESLILLPKLAITLADLPAGYWINERSDQRSFYFLWNDAIEVEAEGLVERWWNQEMQLCLTLYADLVEGTFSTSLSKAPLW